MVASNRYNIFFLHNQQRNNRSCAVADNDLKIHIIDTMPFNISGTVKKYSPDMISFGWLNESLMSQVLFRLIFKTGLKNASREVEKAQKEGAKVMAGIANTAEETIELKTIFQSLDEIKTDNPEMALSAGKWLC